MDEPGGRSVTAPLERLVAGWKVPLLIAVFTGVAITVVGPAHIDLQMADDADAFRRYLREPGRQMAAAVIDVVFAAAYATLGVAVLRAIGACGVTAVIAGSAIVAGALFDEIENVFLIANIARHETLTDGWVSAMQVPGTLKWVATPGFLVLFGLMLAAAVRRRRTGGR